MFPTSQYDLGLRALVNFRPMTSDEDIIRAVLIDRTEYALFVGCNPRVIFDVGANIGVTSILFANSYPNALIYAFEPEPENFKLLVENTEAYENVKPFNVALGDRTEKRGLRPSDDEYNLGGFSFHDKGVDMKRPEKTVDVVSIQDFLTNERLQSVDLLKVDTEGCEFEIIKALGPNFPPYIMGEAHGQNDWKILDLLSATHEIEVKKDFKQRCFPFHAMRKLNVPGH